eukprot:709344_1
MQTFAMKHHNNPYLHILSTMDPCGQSLLVQKYNEEAMHYHNTVIALTCCDHVCPITGTPDFVVCIHDKIICLLQEILNDGSLALDVAFCRLIVLLGSIDCVPYYRQYIAFLLYFVAGSCLPSLRNNIKIDHINHPFHRYLYHNSELVRYLMDTYFAKLNDKRCIKFKYNSHGSTRTISGVLQHHIATATKHGDVSIVPIICDYVQYPNEEFLYFI